MKLIFTATAALLLALCLPTTHSYVVVTYDDANNASPEQPHPLLLGTESCTYGPSYWCHNLTHASRCHAVKHCISHIWSTLHLPADNDSVCETCKEMVKEARDQLLSNETQDELRQVLEGSCKLIPLKLISRECIQLMDDFMPELVDALASRMDPQTVCAVSGLCNSARIDGMLVERQEQFSSMLNCPTCTGYMDKFLSYLKANEKSLQESLLIECGYLGSYSDSCRKAVLEDFEGIEKFLEEKNGHEFCQLIGICGDDSEGDSTQVAEESKNDELECDFCKQLVNHLKNWLTQNTTKEEFEQVVKGLCKASKSHEKECIEFFDEYGSEVYRLIMDDLDPEGFCARVGVCNKRGGYVKPAVVSTILKVHEENEMKGLETPLEGGTCDLCKLASEKIEEYLESPETEKDVEKFVETLCSRHLPKEMAEQCDEFVNEYGEQLIELIVQGLKGEEVCTRLGLCRAVPATTPTNKVADILPTCPICEFTVTKLIDLIGRNHTKESIEAATERVCHMMPKKYLEECEGFMRNYGDRVIEMILVDGTAHEICAAVHLCLFRERVQVVAIGDDGEDDASLHDDDPKCVLCEFVMTTLAERIRDNATEAEIKEEVESICGRLPRTVRGKCRDFVDTYGDAVIAYLVNEMDPDTVCQELRLCRAKNMEGQVTLTTCSLCTILEGKLKLERDQEKIKEGFCPKLGPVSMEMCTSFLTDYGPYMERLIDAKEKDVCDVLQIC